MDFSSETMQVRKKIAVKYLKHGEKQNITKSEFYVQWKKNKDFLKEKLNEVITSIPALQKD